MTPSQRPTVKCHQCGRISELPFAVTSFDFGMYAPREIACDGCGSMNLWPGTVAELPEYKLEELQKITKAYRSITTNEPELGAVATSFISNLDRVVAQVEFPWWLICTVLEQVRLVDATANRMSITGGDAIERAEELSAAVRRVMRDRRKPSADEDIDQLQIAKLFSAPSIDELLYWRGNKWAGIAIESILAGMVVNAYTAFEVLAEDLWTACLNARPRLAFNALNAVPSSEDDVSELDRKRNVRTQIPVWMLQEPDFDLRHNMGVLLKEQSRWRFDRRDKAADAYFSAFGKDVPQLKSVFEGDELKWIAACRNALVHSAGVADKEFVKLISKHDVLRMTHLGERIQLDGSLVADFVNSAASLGTQLFSFAAGWVGLNRT